MNKLFIFVMAAFAASLLFAGGASGQTTKFNLSEQWGKQYSTDFNNDISGDIIFTAKDGNLLIAGSSNNWSSEGNSCRFWVWMIDKNGIKKWEKEIKKQRYNCSTHHAKKCVRCVVELENGNLEMVAEFADFTTSLLELDQEGNIVKNKEIIDNKLAIDIDRIIISPDNNFYLVGTKGDDIYVLKTDKNGNKIADQAFDAGKMEIMTDCALDKDGNLNIIGESGDFDKFGAGDSKVLMLKYEPAKNTITKKAEFQGRNGIFAPSSDEGFIVAYDFSTKFMQQYIKVRKLTKDYSKSWETTISINTTGTGPFYVASLKNEEYMIIGTNENLLWFNKLNKAGKLEGSYTLPGETVMEVTKILQQDNDIYILASAVQDANLPQSNFNYKVSLFKVR